MLFPTLYLCFSFWKGYTTVGLNAILCQMSACSGLSPRFVLSLFIHSLAEERMKEDFTQSIFLSMMKPF